ncbi:hypothetical protein BDR04DRAFT_1188158 [Suillus decipiens]|nr:hypothetical protein BDR04DRAFT_1188158 [Suillus decipiens]
MAVWRARLFLFVGFAFMAGGQAGGMRFRETAIWVHLVHDNIITLRGTTEDDLVLCLITEQGATLTIASKLKLSNVLVDINSEECKACLTDLDLSNVLGECFEDQVVEESTVRFSAMRRHDCPCHVKLIVQNYIYYFGRVVFGLWHRKERSGGFDETRYLARYKSLNTQAHFIRSQSWNPKLQTLESFINRMKDLLFELAGDMAPENDIQETSER